MIRIVQLLVFALLLGRSAVHEGRVRPAPHELGAGSLGSDTSGLAGSNEPLQQALLPGAPAVRTVVPSDGGAAQWRVTSPRSAGSESAVLYGSFLPDRGFSGTILGRAPPTILS